MACTLIAGKVEECNRRVRDVVNIYHWLWTSIRGQSPYQMLEYVGEEYYRWRDRVTNVELAILRELGFHVQPEHPVGLLINYLNALEISSDVRVAQRALNYLNDGLRTVVYLCYPPAVVACAAISLAADDFGIALPEGEPCWWAVFDVRDAEQLGLAKASIRSAYGYKVDFSGVPLIHEELEEDQRVGQAERTEPKESKGPIRGQLRAHEGSEGDDSGHRFRIREARERTSDDSRNRKRGRSRDQKIYSRPGSRSRTRSRSHHRSKSRDRSQHRRYANADRPYSEEYRRLDSQHRPRSRTSFPPVDGKGTSASRSRSRYRRYYNGQ